MTDTWTLTEERFDLASARAYEGLFTLGSGYLHLRGSLEEGLSSAPQNLTYTRMPANVTSEKFAETPSRCGMYVPGVFGKHPLLNNEMINLPCVLGLVPVIAGERLDLATCQFSDYRRTLGLRRALLTRTLRWQPRIGGEVTVCFERFVDAAHPHLIVQRLRLTPDRDIELDVLATIDADVRTNGYDHFIGADLSQNDRGNLACRVETDGRDTISIASRLSGPFDRWTFAPGERAAGLSADGPARSGQTIVIEKRTAVCTSRDLQPVSPEDALNAITAHSYEELLDAHAAEWQRRWDRCAIEIEGDDESQLAVRAALFHLLRAHVTGDDRVAIDAKGYAGEAYWGRFFWDSEIYLLPFYLYTDPPRARTLVDFRVRTLPGARANAARYGYPGARYAWESDAAGIDCCPNWQYGDHEVHVTADVAYAFAHYARATGDTAYLGGDAATVLVETARYWMARFDTRPGDDYPSLLGVMGPDEYTPISSNNAFTNGMVAFALALAAEHGKAAGATDAERSAWRTASEQLPILRTPDGLVLQCEEFPRLAEPRFEERWKDRNRTFASQVSQERLYRSKCLKQADTLMLMLLQPWRFTGAEIRKAWDYYVPYTTHDSSLSAGAHAILAARLDKPEEAWSFWEQARAIDLDTANGGAAEGIHIANAGAVWQMVVLGFAGMRTALESETLTFEPRLPATWRRLRFPLAWRGRRLRVEITGQEVSVELQSGDDLDVVIGRKLHRATRS